MGLWCDNQDSGLAETAPIGYQHPAPGGGTGEGSAAPIIVYGAHLRRPFAAVDTRLMVELFHAWNIALRDGAEHLVG